MTKAILLAGSFLLATAAWADDHELHEAMEKIGKAMGILRKAVPAKSMTDVSAAAGVMIAELPKSMPSWESRKMTDAQRWTKEGIAYATELKSAADAGNAEGVSAAMSKVGGTCKSCHTAHREEIPDTNPKKYKIK
jgi:cytochrome c556